MATRHRRGANCSTIAHTNVSPLSSLSLSYLSLPLSSSYGAPTIPHGARVARAAAATSHLCHCCSNDAFTVTATAGKLQPRVPHDHPPGLLRRIFDPAPNRRLSPLDWDHLFPSIHQPSPPSLLSVPFNDRIRQPDRPRSRDRPTSAYVKPVAPPAGGGGCTQWRPCYCPPLAPLVFVFTALPSQRRGPRALAREEWHQRPVLADRSGIPPASPKPAGNSHDKRAATAKEGCHQLRQRGEDHPPVTGTSSGVPPRGEYQVGTTHQGRVIARWWGR